MTSLSHKIFAVLTQENTTPDLCYHSSSLGPILGPEINVHKGCFEPPSFKDPEPNVNPTQHDLWSGVGCLAYNIYHVCLVFGCMLGGHVEV